MSATPAQLPQEEEKPKPPPQRNTGSLGDTLEEELHKKLTLSPILKPSAENGATVTPLASISTLRHFMNFFL
jgi:hypothetical protein